ncbi:MAG: LCP family protein [Bifidobacterium sp.]|jgi:LCP family protein required for cell wall assembly|nr:LCP family protein [Bifidobacterium sp.]MCI1865725.1 LCP family protein [Bifidobacterium sp.]
MGEDTNGMGNQGNPPSFVPSGSRRRPSPVASKETGRHDTSNGAPPSFIPGPAKREGSRRSTMPHSPGQASPRGYAPERQPAPRQPRSSHSAAPGYVRGSSPSSSPNIAGQRSSARPAQGRATRNRLDPSRGNVVAIGRGSRRHHPGKVIATVLLCLLLACALALFGTWNWVNGKLNKSAWLTDMPNTSGTSWLILGSDQRDGGQGGDDNATETPGFRTDTILVLTKPSHGNSSLISIPRDSLVKEKGTYMKINAVSESYGQKELVSRIEGITGQKIDHAAQIKFGGLKNVVNALGGVQLCYSRTVNDSYSGLNWKAGCHLADGGTALAFSRMRHADPLGDFGRAERQRQVIAAIAKKASSASVLTNVGMTKKVAEASLDSVSVDDQTNPYTLLQMVLAFKEASGTKGVTGSVYWTDPDYYVDGVGSTVLLDDSKNLSLFSELASGSHASGTVGTLASATS